MQAVEKLEHLDSNVLLAGDISMGVETRYTPYRPTNQILIPDPVDETAMTTRKQIRCCDDTIAVVGSC